ncbi:MAG: hypothetical protein ACOC2U_04645 [bacterium]
MASISLKDAEKRRKIFRCPDCPMKFLEVGALYEHVKETHRDNIPEKVTVKQYVFNRKYKKTKGQCVIDRKETKWNEEKGKYERYCSERCRKKARENFKKNAKRKLGTINPAANPEHQIKAIKGRRYSGEYKFKDGGIVGYSSSFEKDFLIFLDEDMGFNSSEVEQAEMIFEIFFDGKLRFHIPDFYLPSYKLIVQIKDGGSNPNTNSHIQNEGRARQKLADKAIIDDGNYNYIKIVNKDYTNFINIIKQLSDRAISDNVNKFDRIICIPE